MTKIKSLKKRNIHIYFLLVFVMLTLTMTYIFYENNQIEKKFPPLIEATHEIQLQTTTAHLWFEEIISGDTTNNINDIIAYIDIAIWNASAILEGGKSTKTTIIALQDTLLILLYEVIKSSEMPVPIFLREAGCNSPVHRAGYSKYSVQALKGWNISPFSGLNPGFYFNQGWN